MDSSLLAQPLHELWSEFRVVQKQVERVLPNSSSTPSLLSTSAEGSGEGVEREGREVEQLIKELKDAEEAVEEALKKCKAPLAALGVRTGDGDGKIGSGYSVDELLSEFLAREGEGEAARSLFSGASWETDVEGLLGLIDCILAMMMHEDPRLGLSWCRKHASRLRRLGSALEIEMATQVVGIGVWKSRHGSGKVREEAEEIARDVLLGLLQVGEVAVPSQWAGARKRARAVAIAALGRGSVDGASRAEAATAEAVVADLARKPRWRWLCKLFLSDGLKALGALPTSRLAIIAKAGAIAINEPNPMRHEHTRRREGSRSGDGEGSGVASASAAASSTASTTTPSTVPIHDPLRILLDAAPSVQRSRSQVKCPVLGSVIGQDVPAVALFSGAVVAEEALKHITDSHGRAHCPITGQLGPGGGKRVYFS